MKFSTTVGAFAGAYSLAQNALDKKKDAEGSMLYIQAFDKAPERILLYATDGLAEILVRLNAKVKEAGTVMIQPRDLGKSLSTLQQEAKIDFTVPVAKDGISFKRLNIKCGSFKPSCPIGGDISFRESLIKSLPFAGKSDLTLPASKLLDVIERTTGFVLKEDDQSQFQFHNILLEATGTSLKAYASNTKVLAAAEVGDVKAESPFELSIPGAAVKSLLALLGRFKSNEDTPADVKLQIARNAEGKPCKFYVRTEDVFYGMILSGYQLPSSSKTLESRFKSEITWMANRKDFQDLLSRCQPFIGGDKHNEMTAQIKDNELVVYDGTGEELDRLTGTGEGKGEGQGTFDLNFLAGVLKASKEEIVTVNFWQHPSQASKHAFLVHSGAAETSRGFYVIPGMGSSVKPVTKEKEKVTVMPATQKEAA